MIPIRIERLLTNTYFVVAAVFLLQHLFSFRFLDVLCYRSPFFRIISSFGSFWPILFLAPFGVCVYLPFLVTRIVSMNISMLSKLIQKPNGPKGNNGNERENELCVMNVTTKQYRQIIMSSEATNIANKRSTLSGSFRLETFVHGLRRIFLFSVELKTCFCKEMLLLLRIVRDFFFENLFLFTFPAK